MRIASWNINSVRARIGHVERFVKEFAPDILCLQETKVADDGFPTRAFADLGYSAHVVAGQKSYNGVAIFSRVPIEVTGGRDWCGRYDARHISVIIPGDIELHNFYVPAGGDIPDRAENEKFGHKLDFLTEMSEWFATARRAGDRMIMLGDLNVAPHESDVWSHKALLKVVSHTPIEVEHLEAVQQAARWCDAARHFRPVPEKLYSWWSYRSPDWEGSDKGRRLDHIWVTEPLVGAMTGFDIPKEPRRWEKPSDHTPVILDLDPDRAA
ncbi:exodeoxyribonuclease III [Oceanibacterium hippocampi]|uniref:Exodeoxyribonuclease III n=1 Tax=Oceanibacterium hippocampi TaxID=745714 RepID=A0A1Y5RHF4_9PROT|nr:exodeoxyribonuclease III [Oceanibacterium hippocampi]SLN17477.1 Exodeoxyribonuclease III [Oceanibacterium hippocampi]